MCVCVCACVRFLFLAVRASSAAAVWLWVVSVGVASASRCLVWLFVPGVFGLAVCAGSVLACVFVCACSVVLVRAWCVR